MAKEVTKNPGISSEELEKMKAAIDKAAGYDVALAWTTLTAVVINEQSDMDIPLFEMRADVCAIGDIVSRMMGGDAGRMLSMYADACIAYGWHRARQGKSLLRDADIERELTDYVDHGCGELLIEERMKKRKEIKNGLATLRSAVAKVEKDLSLMKEVKR